MCKIMSPIEVIRRYLCRILGCQARLLPKLHFTREYNFSEVLSLLRSEFGEDTAIFLSDEKYKSIPKNEFGKLLKLDDTDKSLYVPIYYDCDDFSFRLMGQLSIGDEASLPFGIIWVQTEKTAHALNVFIDDKEQVWLVEPQNDAIFKKPKKWSVYFVIM